MSIGLSRNGYGVLRLVKPGEIMHWCEACNAPHVFNVHDLSQNGRVIGWDGDFERPTISEPVRFDKDGWICEYILQGGVVHYMNDCSHAMAGRSLPLKNFPLP